MDQNKISLIIPAAGKSSRFHTKKPKWLLTTPDGKLMLHKSIEGLNISNVGTIYITVLKEHINKHCQYGNNDPVNNLLNSFNEDIRNKIKICVLDEGTSCQPETVMKTIKQYNIKGPIFIKDVDNYYKFTIEYGNYVCTLNINKENQNTIGSVASKSYVILKREENIIVNIVEKQIVSDTFCVGGYSFENSIDYVNSYIEINKINEDEKEIYTSHVIYNLLLKNIVFTSKNICNFKDWGTYEEWIKFQKEYTNLLVDLDGCLVESSGEYFQPRWGESNALEKNCKKIRDMFNNGKTLVIILTARKEKFRDITIEQLKKNNIPYHQIIFGLYHCSRIAINDFFTTNPYPSIIAINLPRNSDTLDTLM